MPMAGSGVIRVWPRSVVVGWAIVAVPVAPPIIIRVRAGGDGSGGVAPAARPNANPSNRATSWKDDAFTEQKGRGEV